MRDEDKAAVQPIEELTTFRPQVAALCAEQASQQSDERPRLLYNMGQTILEAYSLAAIAHAPPSHIRQLIPCQRTSIALLDFDACVIQV